MHLKTCNVQRRNRGTARGVCVWGGWGGGQMMDRRSMQQGFRSTKKSKKNTLEPRRAELFISRALDSGINASGWSVSQSAAALNIRFALHGCAETLQ